MKKWVLVIFLAAGFLSACNSLHIGPKGEGEYVTAESLVPYDENNLRQVRKDGVLAAQKAAVEKVAGIFISSATTVEQAQLVEEKITSKTAGFIRRSHTQKAYRKGDEWYTQIKAMVLVKNIGDIIKEAEADAFSKKATVLIASREMIGEELSLKQDCKQAIYRALKAQPITLINGDNLSQNNLENPNSILEKARREGERFVIMADVETKPLEVLTATASPFKSYRANANVRVYATNNYAPVAEGAQQQSGLDPLPEIAAQKSISAACEGAAKQLTESLLSAINSTKTFKLTVKNVNTVERLKMLQDILKKLDVVEDFNLVRYANSAAYFDVFTNISTSYELEARMLLQYNVNLTVEYTTPSSIVMTLK